jgi:hypothetical protein
MMAAEAPRVARGLAALALVLALGSVLLARGSPSRSADHPSALALQHYQETEGGEARWYLESEERELPAALAPDFERAPEGPLGALRPGRSCFQRPAPQLESPPPRIELGSEGDADDLLRVESRAGARLLILQLPEGWTPLALQAGGRRTALAAHSARTLRLAGFGRTELALECQRDEPADRQQQIELFEIDSLRESAAREWIDKRPPEFVPLSSGDVSIVRSTRKL